MRKWGYMGNEELMDKLNTTAMHQIDLLMYNEQQTPEEKLLKIRGMLILLSAIKANMDEEGEE